MASKPDTARNSSGIERVGKRKKGYSVEQVNDFLERAHSLYESSDISLTQKDIQDVSFDLEDEGYAIPQVDAALSRLERAVEIRLRSTRFLIVARLFGRHKQTKNIEFCFLIPSAIIRCALILRNRVSLLTIKNK